MATHLCAKSTKDYHEIRVGSSSVRRRERQKLAPINQLATDIYVYINFLGMFNYAR